MYLYGFGNHHQTEAVEGSLPLAQNSPQQCHLGLYAEQISGSAFTRERHLNYSSWMYRILPSAAQGRYTPYIKSLIAPLSQLSPNPLRWSKVTHSNQESCDFIDGLLHVAQNKTNNVFTYTCTQSMEQRYFVSYDGELLFIPYVGNITLHTEFGLLALIPGMIAVIPRGTKFKVTIEGNLAQGYLCENQAHPLTLPNLGPIGANGLASPRHFEYPVASFERCSKPCTIICKNSHNLWIATSDHSPLNVVAWHGNYAPYRYDLSLFNTINTVSFDHPDPSIFTVLTSESNTKGVANLDFVIFPPRWMVAEHTFRPPYFHRNCMSELMGLIHGVYDAKPQGFVPGGMSIHNCMTPHGPDSESFSKAFLDSLEPEYYQSLAFMLESQSAWYPTETAMNHSSFQNDYTNCWGEFKVLFN